MIFSSTNDVFDWMSEKTGERTFYLEFLNLHHTGEKLAFWLNAYSDLARILRSQPDVLRKMLMESPWRPSLVANVVIILLRAQEFEKDLVQRLVQGSWIAPQLAVSTGLISTGRQIATLEDSLDQLIARYQEYADNELGKHLMSVYAALKLIGSHRAVEFQNSTYFHEITPSEVAKDNWRHADNLRWVQLIQTQWDFWSAIDPIRD